MTCFNSILSTVLREYWFRIMISLHPHSDSSMEVRPEYNFLQSEAAHMWFTAQAPTLHELV